MDSRETDHLKKEAALAEENIPGLNEGAEETPTITLKDLANRKIQDDRLETIQQNSVSEITQQVETLTPEQRKRVDDIKASIDLMDSQVGIQYGIGAQRNISDFSETILTNIKNKDTGYVGELLTDLMFNVKDLEINKLGESDGLLSKIPGLNSIVRKVERFTTKYQTIELQIDKIENSLEGARMEIMKDIVMFDALYQKNLEYFNDLQLYILAGEEKIKELREITLPQLHSEAIASSDPMDAQLVRDFEDTVNRFEKKIHDLKLSKVIAIQTAPQIKLIQNNDKLLVDKIQTAVLNTVPLWKSQIVIAIGLYRQNKALGLQKKVSETTNELLKKNSELLKTNTIEVARESEKGIVELETLKKVNSDLISTIEETIKIQKEGHAQRQKAEVELLQLEDQLRSTLLKTKN